MATSLQHRSLTAQQLQQMLKGSAAERAAARQYLLSHLGNEPAGVTGPGGIAGTLDNAVTAVPNAVNAAGKTFTGVTDALTYVIKNTKYAAIWAGLFVLGLVLIVKGLGVKTPSPKIVPVPV